MALEIARRVIGGVWKTGVADEGNGGGSSLPTAAPIGVTVDTTTYDDNVSGSGKLTTLVFPNEESVAALAFAIDGDDYPRLIFTADPTDWGTIMLGDGNTDPTDGGPLIGLIAGDGGLVFRGNSCEVKIGSPDPNRGVQNPITGISVLGGAAVLGDSGDPNGVYGGYVGDLFIRTDGNPDAGTYLYVCTSAGPASGMGAAVWSALSTSLT